MSMHETVRSNVIVNLIRTITMTILSFVTFPYVCRVLGDSMFGLYSWAVSFVYYFLVIARISIPNIAVREIVKVKNDPEKLSQKTHEFFIIQAVTTLLSFGLLCAVFFSVPAFRINFAEPVVFILSLNFLTGVLSFEWIFTAFEKHTYMAVRSIVVATIVDILIFALVKYPEHLPLYAFLCVLTTILTVISNLIYLPFVVKLQKPKKLNFKQYLPTIGIMFAISVVAAVYDKTDTFILGLLDTSKAAVGSYAVGMKGVEIVIGVITALSTVFIPRATAYYATNDERQFKNINIYASNIAMFIVVPAIVLMICLSKPLTLLIGGTYGYENANMVLIALASLMLTFSICNIIYTQILIPMKREKTYLFTMLFGAITNIAFSLLFGMVFWKNNPAFGVALGTAITDALVLLIMFLLTREHSRHILLNKNNLIIIGVSALLVASTILLNKYLEFDAKTVEDSMLIKIVVIFGIDLVIYLVGCFLAKEKLVRSFFKKS